MWTFDFRSERLPGEKQAPSSLKDFKNYTKRGKVHCEVFSRQSWSKSSRLILTRSSSNFSLEIQYIITSRDQARPI